MPFAEDRKFHKRADVVLSGLRKLRAAPLPAMAGPPLLCLAPSGESLPPGPPGALQVALVELVEDRVGELDGSRMEVAHVGGEPPALAGDRLGHARMAVTDAWHVVVGVEEPPALGVEEPDALAADDVHGVSVREPCQRRAEDSRAPLEELVQPVFLLSDAYLANGSEPWLIPGVKSIGSVV